MEFKVDPEVLRTLVQKAVLDEMTPEAKEKILLNAVAGLFQKPPLTLNGPKLTPLESLFQDQVQNMAGKMVEEYLEHPEQKQAIQTAIATAWQQMLSDTDRYKAMIDRMARAFAMSITGERY